MGRSPDGTTGRPPAGRFGRSGHTSHSPRADRSATAHTEPLFGRATVHSRRGSRPVRAARAVVRGGHRTVRGGVRLVVDASAADGARESGLTALIWNQVLSYGTDAMITVALAGTVFFGASSNAQRGNVLLYLLVTMAPFAVVAPFIGPVLDRFQHGRRTTMAVTAAGRAVLAVIMAGHPTDLLVLYPCALGSLVLSKAYGVVRAAATPRLVPEGLTLTQANSRITMFGLGSTIVLGGLVGAVIRVSGSYPAGLLVTAGGFATCAFFALRLPGRIDSPLRPRTRRRTPPAQRPTGRLGRLVGWARRGYPPVVVVALQGEAALRLLSGMLTIYLAFYVESTRHGFAAASGLALVVGAAGLGNFLGTAVGTRVSPARPDLVIVGSVCGAAVACLAGASVFALAVVVGVVLVCSVTNALSKISLDSMIQNDVAEALRSSAFARSETFLQLAWVVGAAIGVVLPAAGTDDGTLALAVATALTGTVAAVVALRTRAMSRLTATPYPTAPGVPAGSVRHD